MPKITPFSFGETPVNNGQFVTSQCTVFEGDLPLTVSWFFNGLLITEIQPFAVVSKVGARVSMLAIESVAADSVGNYTCTAVNKAGTTSHTAILLVNGLNYFLNV